MDIERVNGAKNKVIFNHNRERALFNLVSPQLGWWAGLRFAWERTFSEDLSQNPLTVTLNATGVNGLHKAIQHRVVELQGGNTDYSYPTEELTILEQAYCRLEEFMTPDIPEAA